MHRSYSLYNYMGVTVDCSESLYGVVPIYRVVCYLCYATLHSPFGDSPLDRMDRTFALYINRT